MINKVDAVEVAGAQLGDLADRASDRVLMAVRTGRGVVERPEAFIYFFAFFENDAVSVELGLRDEPVSLVVEAGWGLCGAGLTVNGIARVKWITDPYREKDQQC